MMAILLVITAMLSTTLRNFPIESKETARKSVQFLPFIFIHFPPLKNTICNISSAKKDDDRRNGAKGHAIQK
jgi:hypothetical protein